MRRLGFAEEELPELLALLAAHRAALPVAGIMTHLAAADDPAHDDFTREQLATFRRMPPPSRKCWDIRRSNTRSTRRASAAFPAAQFDMVRLGVGLYGVEAGAEDAHNLRPSAR